MAVVPDQARESGMVKSKRVAEGRLQYSLFTISLFWS